MTKQQMNERDQAIKRLLILLSLHRGLKIIEQQWSIEDADVVKEFNKIKKRFTWHMTNNVIKLYDEFFATCTCGSTTFYLLCDDTGDRWQTINGTICTKCKEKINWIRAEKINMINRQWAMSNKNTFTIPPIKLLVNKYVSQAKVIIDPFSNNSMAGTITNDINPEFNTDYNLDALDFMKKIKTNTADLVLFDPPYSMRQATECYKNYEGKKLEPNVTNMKYWKKCKNEVARILKHRGISITCGWNSNGIGKVRGFKIVEILLVPHGGHKNDTIVTVEVKDD